MKYFSQLLIFFVVLFMSKVYFFINCCFLWFDFGGLGNQQWFLQQMIWLYYYNDSCLIKMKGNDLVVNLYKDNYYKGNGGGGLM